MKVIMVKNKTCRGRESYEIYVKYVVPEGLISSDNVLGARMVMSIVDEGDYG